ncbi:hypothetical protein DRR62_25610 [Escherichia coli]|nr:hypothetical protein [Escherichia coli]EFN8241280.1 hypothetical protein [Escherichia coli]EFO2385663.1 hypothetical protein [Escherichia coli]MIA07651.1 hypothetical protein [Escherichia coli]
MSEKRKFNVIKLRNIVVDDDKEDQTNLALLITLIRHRNRKHYCEYHFTIANSGKLFSFVIT